MIKLITLSTDSHKKYDRITAPKQIKESSDNYTHQAWINCDFTPPAMKKNDYSVTTHWKGQEFE